MRGWGCMEGTSGDSCERATGGAWRELQGTAVSARVGLHGGIFRGAALSARVRGVGGAGREFSRQLWGKRGGVSWVREAAQWRMEEGPWAQGGSWAQGDVTSTRGWL